MVQISLEKLFVCYIYTLPIHHTIYNTCVPVAVKRREEKKKRVGIDYSIGLKSAIRLFNKKEKKRKKKNRKKKL